MHEIGDFSIIIGMSKTPDLFTLAEHADLLKKLNEWDIAYHQKDAPVVDDATYDAAKSRALAIESEFPELAKNGASTHVGAAVAAGFKSYPHTVPMLSISDVFNQGEVADWFDKLADKNLFIELKSIPKCRQTPRRRHRRIQLPQ